MPDQLPPEQEQMPDTETRVRRPNSLLILIAGVAIGLVGVGIVYAGYTFLTQKPVEQYQDDNAVADAQIMKDGVPLDIYTGPKAGALADAKTDSYGTYIELTPRRQYRTNADTDIVTTTNRFYIPFVAEEYNIEIEWIEGPKERIPREQFYVFADYENPDAEYINVSIPDPYIYKAGTFKSTGPLNGLEVFAFFTLTTGLGTHANAHFLIFPNGFEDRPIELLSETDVENPQLRSQNTPFEDEIFSYIMGVDLRAQEPPEIISYQKDKDLTFTQYAIPDDFDPFGGTYPSYNLLGLMNVVSGTYSQIPEDARLTDASGYNMYESDSVYYHRLADGRLALYETIPSFFARSAEGEDKDMFVMGFRTEGLKWVTGKESSARFDFAGDVTAGGCGFVIERGTSDVSDMPWLLEEDFVPVAFKDGDPILYEVHEERRVTHPYYVQFFQDFAAVGRLYDEDIESIYETEFFETYISGMPLVFWKSEQDTWHVFYNIEFTPAVECGKPVIYLYPEETTDVRVEVVPNGGFTYVEPDYPDDGWVVRASPKGELYNYAEKTVYPYLYWEGHADGFGYSDRGWLFTRDTLEADLTRLLLDIGLNDQETKDFVEFWMPRMVDDPYVFVTFARQEDFERAAPLTVTPTPDSIFRIFMYFEGRDTFTDVEPLPYQPYERHGFSVVEWGGTLEDSKK